MVERGLVRADRLRCSRYWAYFADCLMEPALYAELKGVHTYSWIS